MAIAIVGSGPAACYTADLLTRALPGLQIDIYERHAEPFGLVRYGVAPDHAGTKAVSQLFARMLKKPGVRLHVNVEVGRDLGIDELEDQYQLVVVATGAGSGRVPEFTGATDLPMLTGLQLAALFNGRELALLDRLPQQAASIAIFGNGNVSLDAARLLAKPAGQLAAVGVLQQVIDWRDALGLQQLHIIGRGNAAQSRFGHNELRELGNLDAFRPVVQRQDLAQAQGANAAVLPLLEGFASQAADARLPIHLHFDSRLQTYQAGMLSLAKGGHSLSLPVDMAVAAIGQRAAPLAGLPYDHDRACIPNTDGLVEGRDKTYVVGWAANPAGGSIPASRQAASALLPRLLARLEQAQAST